jgi:hypothetical protein
LYTPDCVTNRSSAPVFLRTSLAESAAITKPVKAKTIAGTAAVM